MVDHIRLCHLPHTSSTYSKLVQVNLPLNSTFVLKYLMQDGPTGDIKSFYYKKVVLILRSRLRILQKSFNLHGECA